MIRILNVFSGPDKIQLIIRSQDVLLGLTIYLKTSLDFAIFIGNMINANSQWGKRIAIETGTAIGNALGTIVVLFIWNFFQQIPLLMAAMTILASLVLFRMSEESLDAFCNKQYSLFGFTKSFVVFLQKAVSGINRLTHPLVDHIVPETGIGNATARSFWSLFFFSITIPFLLGLDDFAGYIPLFSIVNVFGFSVGVFLGHMLLNTGLFFSPKQTMKLVKHPLVPLLGGVVFVGIALLGLLETAELILHL